jgi:hypothetical protein
MIKMTRAAVMASALLAATVQTEAFDRDRDRDIGWGAYYNNHLSSWNGRPLGPPLPALPPGYQYYNGRLVAGVEIAPRAYAYPGLVSRPHVRNYRIMRERSASRQHR